MHILISNDDGYKSKGIQVLINELKKIAQITVVAPSRNRSGASSSLSLDRSIKVTKKEDSFYFLSGTPTDCVHIALTGLMQTLPDMVISGINHGPNLGDDTIYSGTVAAAIEGYLLDIPSFAISMGSVNPKHFETAAKVTSDLIKLYNKQKVTSASLLNINVPDIPYDELKGLEVTRLGKRHAAEKAMEKKHTQKESLYWIGEVGQPNDGGPGTDFYALKNNFVSISPIHPDLTDFKKIEITKNWIK
ncbi:MAG: 5'/3'-nucleotidase SurE [Betaproteobacteria bacterium]|nr:5'/3'-nucleotidase SurE [Nitrosomonadales bacterium]MCH9771057.1 5'/3'-nucleotidase SurE [Betaproteobacteria bacterium]